jgi:pimeloyl-ACP methyl ester carboxylesterase
MRELRKHGKQPFLVAVIHGGPGAPGDMYSVARRLSKTSGVLEPLQTKSSISKLVNQLKKVIEKNVDKPLTLIGHSWGSWLSILFAAQYPSKVRKLILVGCAPLEQKYAKNIMENRLNRLSNSEKNRFSSLIETLQNKDKQKNIAVLLEFFKKTDSYEPIRVKENRSFSLKLHNLIWNEAENLRKTGQLLDYVDKITCPITIVHGKYDPHPLKGVIKPLEDRGRDVNLIVLEKCGHTPWTEKYAKKVFYTAIKREILPKN